MTLASPTRTMRQRDYRHLITCKFEKVNISTDNSENETTTNTLRDTVRPNQFVDTYIQTGRKHSGHKLQVTEKTLKPKKQVYGAEVVVVTEAVAKEGNKAEPRTDPIFITIDPHASVVVASENKSFNVTTKRE